MISISTWNIQCGLGCDGKVDLKRIASTLMALGDADVICLQEVARFMPELDQGAGKDQVDILKDFFPDHEAFFGAAINRSGPVQGARQQFGNLILSRLPVVQVFTHPLPQPPDSSVRHMPRQVTEVVVRKNGRPLRILTTHLEYHSTPQRLQQIAAIRRLHQENCMGLKAPGIDPGSGPYAITDRPESLVVCGDFNFPESSPEYQKFLAGFDDNTSPFVDAWGEKYSDTPHSPTCGIYDRRTWPQGPHCRDFFFVTNDLGEHIQKIVVDVKTDASDHQPLLLVLEC